MRKLGKLLLLIIFLLIVIPLMNWGIDLLHQREEFGVAPPEGTQRMRNFQLQEKAWTQFSVPQMATRLRVLVTAGLLNETRNPTPAHAEVEYRLLDEKRTELHRKTYLIEIIPDEIAAKTESVLKKRYLPVAGSKVYGELDYFIDLSGFPDTREIQLRLVKKDRHLDWLAMRLGFRIDRSLDEASMVWLRLSKKQQDELSDASIIPSDLLYPEQKQALLQMSWEAIGPIGINRRDYNEIILFRLPYPIVMPQIPVNIDNTPGLYVDHQNWATLTASDVPPTYVFRSFTQQSSWVEVQCFLDVKSPPQLFTLQIASATAPLRWQPPRGASLLLLKSQDPIRVTMLVADKELAPPPTYLRVWRLEKGVPLNFEIEHVQQQPAPWRLDVRTLFPLTRTQVRYQGFSAQGTIVLNGAFDYEGANLPHLERLTPFDPQQQLFEAQSFFLEVPPEVVRLEVVSSELAFVNAFSRPLTLSLQRTLPPPLTPWADSAKQLWPWYTLLPMENHKLPNTFASLQVHQKPPEILPPPPLTQWEDFAPSGNFNVARTVYLTRLDQPADTPALNDILYREVKSQQQRVHLSNLAGVRSVRPELLLIRETDEPAPLTVQWDQQAPWHTMLAGKMVHLRLPDITTGEHLLGINHRAADVYMNRLAPQLGSSALLSRMAWQVPAAGLDFSITKRELLELLNVQLISTTSAAPIEVNLQLHTEQRLYPALNYSFPQRHYVLSPQIDVTANAYVEQSASPKATAYPLIGMPLGDDLPAGLIRLHISTNRPGTLVVVSRVARSEAGLYRIFEEDRRVSP